MSWSTPPEHLGKVPKTASEDQHQRARKRTVDQIFNTHVPQTGFSVAFCCASASLFKVDVPVLPSPLLQRESVNIFMTNLHGCLQQGKVEQLFDTSVPRIA